MSVAKVVSLVWAYCFMGDAEPRGILNEKKTREKRSARKESI